MTEIVNFDTKKGSKSSAEPQQSANDEKDARRYSSDEVADVIRQALQSVNSRPNTSVDHQEMLSIGEEFGLREEDIDKAYEDLLDQRDMDQLQTQLWRGFKFAVVINLVIAIVLITIDILLVPDNSFALYPVFIMGVILLFHGLIVRRFPNLITSIFNFHSDIETGSMASFTTEGLHISSGLFFTYRGMVIHKGLLSIEDDFLIMEYRTMRDFLGRLRSEVKEIRIPLKDILGVKLERQFWMSKLILQGARLKTFENVPGESGSSLHLTFYPRARVAIHNLARDIESHIGGSSS